MIINNISNIYFFIIRYNIINIILNKYDKLNSHTLQTDNLLFKRAGNTYFHKYPIFFPYNVNLLSTINNMNYYLIV